LTEQEAFVVVKQLIAGIKDIHTGRVVHRDLKLANILLHFPDIEMGLFTKEERINFIKEVNLSHVRFQIKISDFGFARILTTRSDRRHSVCGTPAYMAPEIIVTRSTYS
jgi:serine/threonine protein kinase